MYAVKGARGPSGQEVIEKPISRSANQGEEKRCFKGVQAC
jgi:hypothetical protein